MYIRGVEVAKSWDRLVVTTHELDDQLGGRDSSHDHQADFCLNAA